MTLKERLFGLYRKEFIERNYSLKRAVMLNHACLKKVKSLKDISVLDADYQKEKERRKKQPSKSSAPANKFNNFESRTYDMNDLERRLLQQ